MPLVSIPSSDAIQNLKSNSAATWPRRGDPGRLHPIAKPRLSPSFQLQRGESVFTIGSCFARNVERALMDEGFDLPARQMLVDDPEFASIGQEAINNYGTPSIFNEIYWAFAKQFDPAACFVETDGKWTDLHVHHSIRPASLEEVVTRRKRVRDAYRSIANSRVVIITLGLVECWFDKERGLYLNTAPRRSLMRALPDRFELRVLSFDEAYGFLRDAMALIKKHGRTDVRVLLTVSPVPLSATYRDTDVMIANTYSKSVLRTCAEHCVAEFDFVDYYPSYESITLSEREAAWTDDNVHVTDAIVRVNVSRMVEAYVGADGLTLDALLNTADENALRPGRSWPVLRDHPEYLSDRRFAEAYIRAAVAAKAPREAADALSQLPDADPLLCAQVALANGDAAEVIRVIGDPPGGVQMGAYFRTLLSAHLAGPNMEAARRTANEWATRSPRSSEPYRMLARASEPNEAERLYRVALDRGDHAPHLKLELAELLVKMGRTAEACETIQGVEAESAHMAARLRKIQEAA